MADHALFYNSVDHDRVYNADSFSDWLKKFFTTGVFTGDLFVTASGSMNVSVGTGYVNINGKVMIYGAATTLTLDPANGIYPRIDTIVVERNDTDRDFYLKVITGDYANLNDPVPTPPVRSGAIYQLVLAQIYVGAGVTEITQANITDTRADDDLCGIVAGTVTEMDFSQFAAQFAEYYQEFKNGYEADFDDWSDEQRQNFANWMADEKDDFDTWFANLHYVLDGDVAGHLQNEIDAIVEGMSGSIFKIHTDEATLIGKTVTVTDGLTFATDTINNSGDAEVKGFTAVGNITITATDGTDTATTVINVPYFGNYPVSLAFWQATVNIQGDENIYGEDVVVTDSAHIIVDTVTLDSAGQGVFYASKADTYTFTVTYEGEDYYESIVVSEETTYNVSIVTMPNGETVTPTDDVSIWLACAGIKDKAYTTLSQVIGDSETFNALLGDSNACAYMARSTTWASTLCADQYAMSMIGQYDVCSLALLGNATWASAIAQSDYVESVYNLYTPKMTSNTTPSGTASAKDTQSGYQVYYAIGRKNLVVNSVGGGNFDIWHSSANDDNEWLRYQFPSAITAEIALFNPYYNTYYSPSITCKDIVLQGSNDGSTWVDLTETLQPENDYIPDTSGGSGVGYCGKTLVMPITKNKGSYTYYQVTMNRYSPSNYRCSVVRFSVFGRADSGEKIHGGNGDTFYRIVDGNHVPITDPATLDVGVYTIYSNGLAKDPSNLSNDYGKQIRICKNTKEIVIRPDGALYWWGYIGDLESAIEANGWSKTGSISLDAPTYSTNNIRFYGGSSGFSGIGKKSTYGINGKKVHSILSSVTGSSSYKGIILPSGENKVIPNPTGSGAFSHVYTNTSVLLHDEYTVTTNANLAIGAYGASGSPDVTINALWLE